MPQDATTLFHCMAINPRQRVARCTVEFKGDVPAPPMQIQDQATNRCFQRKSETPNDTGHWEYFEMRPYTVVLVYDSETRAPAPAQEELLDDRDEIEV